MYVSSTGFNIIKNFLVLNILIVAPYSFAMEQDAVPEQFEISLDLNGVELRKEFAKSAGDAVADFKAKINNFLSGWPFGAASESNLNNLENIKNIENAVEIKSDLVLPTDNKIENKDASNNQSIKLIRLTKKNAVIFGIGAIALITVGYATYVLYKNGTLKKASDAMRKHSYSAMSSIAGSVVILGSFLTYNYYKTKPINV